MIQTPKHYRPLNHKIGISFTFAYFALQMLHEFSHLGVGVFNVGNAFLNAGSAKVTKHEEVCMGIRQTIVLYVLETFGLVAPEVMEFLIESKKSCTLII